MPVHLKPISRRRFLRRALAAGGGLALAPHLFAQRDQDPNSWALLADTHLSADRALLVRGVNMVQHFKSVAAELLALPQRPAGLFIVGDCAYNTGQPADYTVLRELLDPVRAGQLPVHLTVGNHDERTHFLEAFADQAKSSEAIGGRRASLLKTPRANWFILDSLEKTQSTPGLLGPEQLKWLADALDANPSHPALVLVHHNPGINGGNLGLKDTQAFLDVIRPRRQVKAYIYGHTHSWRTEQDSSGIQFVNLPAVSYVFHEGDPSGWVLARLGDDHIELELRCLDPSHKAHGRKVELPWRA